MKYFCSLLVFFLTVNSFAQNWRTEIEQARELYQKNDFEKAYEHYVNAKKSVPKNFNFTTEMAQCAYKKKNFEEARNLYTHSLKASKNNLEKSAIYYNKGNSFMEEKNYANAIAAYKKALKKNPADEEARYNLSQALRKKNKNKEEDKSQKQSTNSKPDTTSSKAAKKPTSPENSSAMSKSALEKKLDNISKAEAATKRKKFSNGSESNSTSTRKNW